ncbi:hypothetical protein SGFS_041870 [Streptomyces graminofaciens]|uniref:Membrane-bound hydrophilic protein n=1 Tax=Streptomyces graminofaciens TaxID=68212 RepID=A0ABM7FA88_9ACTN|nr:hypothetical protein [Streptomyces graminofaciens]BBC32893.1 hypothetical protein SGFS_041870 [Streptomyces graminofaciens]
MPAEPMGDESAAGSRTRTGPRHAAPKKPLLTRLHVPTGKAIALAAMPTAVLMGMGFTPTLALADDPSSSKSLTADEYKDCVSALEGEDAEETTATPSPSASASESASEDKDEDKSEDTTSDSSDSGSSSSDSGSDDKDDDTAEPTPTDTATQDTSTGDDASTDTSSSSTETTEESGGNVLEDIGNALEDIFTPGDTDDATSDDAAASPSATPSPSASEDETDTAGDAKEEAEKDAKAATTDDDTAKDVTDTVEDAAEKAKEDTDTASSSPSPSPSETELPKSCVAATDDESGVEKGIPLLADDPWTLEASSLTLKGADYKGIVKVKTADGTVKEVLKYVVSDGTDIGDLHQIVDDPAAGVQYHVKAGKGTTSEITGGKTVMYTESISGNLLGLIPVTFDPKHPPPVNIPWIYFTKVKVIQAAQFGGTLKVPGMQQSITPLG